eukprot:CAMPEP_0172524740 /NCGR_PEP_ID=MMETSP1066-20121228/294349_1 /TAXON_ID=671091 /ORGANISM="Coscinodiscus wailesii, Strain CCMP2513" /LENGTH=86 /DNA_ID=CAMNT_0013307889 /DNA_START=428 /DNA_END=688 /DNA_ORIENTATION=+
MGVINLDRALSFPDVVVMAAMVRWMENMTRRKMRNDQIMGTMSRRWRLRDVSDWGRKGYFSEGKAFPVQYASLSINAFISDITPIV